MITHTRIRTAAVFVAAAFALLASACSVPVRDTGSNSGYSPSDYSAGAYSYVSEVEPTPEKSWHDKDMKETSYGKVAFKFADHDTYECDSGQKCSKLIVTVKSGCPGGAYIKANALDSSGAVVDDAIDISGALQAGDTAKLNLVTYDKSARRFQLTEVGCL